MNAHIEPLITVPLALTAHTRAEKFRTHQANPTKAKQVYLNTLAVYAVNVYLQCQGFETDLVQSDSWNPTMQTLMDVADLEVKNYGKLECRPILPKTAVMSIPAEVWSERIGYVAVHLDESLREATLLGFSPTVREGEISLEQLEPLSALPEYLSQQKQLETNRESVRLSQWLTNFFEAISRKNFSPSGMKEASLPTPHTPHPTSSFKSSWQTFEELLLPSQAQLAFNFRNASNVETEPAGKLAPVVKKGKLLNLRQQPGDEPIALLIGLQPTELTEINISVEIYPTGKQIYLPQDLKLIVLDEAGEAVMQAQAKSTKKIQLEFSGEPEESFSIKVALGDVSITEAFVI